MNIPSPIPEPILNTYFAVQLLPREHPQEEAAAICKAAKDVGALFRRLEVIDTLPLGTGLYIRCRSDVVNPYPMLEKLLEKKRGFVAAKPDGGFVVKLANGRVGQLPGSTMHAVARGGFHATYKGPKIKLWERQFPGLE